jgi:hypothetical protein
MQLYHYTSQQAAQDIHCSRTISPGRSGILYLTDERYKEGTGAADRLAIIGKPVQCYCEVPQDTTLKVTGPHRVYPLILKRKIVRLGGGVEYRSHSAVTFARAPKWKVLHSP